MTTLTLNVLRCPDTVSAEQRQLQGGELTLGRDGRSRGQVGDQREDLALDAVVLRDLHRTS